MPEVVIGSISYPVYADVEAANNYFAAASHAAAWVAATVDQKGQALVTSTRTLDRQRWLGDKTDPDQDLAWPRTNTGVDGVEDDEVPANIITASMEMALSILNGEGVQTDQNVSQKIQSLKAGSVSITYFRGAEGQPLRFPLIVHELIRDYLAATGRLGLSGIATGVDGASVTNEDFGYTRGL